jgi:hypothetical protein
MRDVTVEQVIGRDGSLHTRLVDPSPAGSCGICWTASGTLDRQFGEVNVGVHLVDGREAGMLCDRCWTILRGYGFDEDAVKDALSRADQAAE